MLCIFLHYFYQNNNQKSINNYHRNIIIKLMIQSNVIAGSQPDFFSFSMHSYVKSVDPDIK